jgi:hypothetical protein
MLLLVRVLLVSMLQLRGNTITRLASKCQNHQKSCKVSYFQQETRLIFEEIVEYNNNVARIAEYSYSAKSQLLVLALVVLEC